jgi:hypothetical protein
MKEELTGHHAVGGYQRLIQGTSRPKARQRSIAAWYRDLVAQRIEVDTRHASPRFGVALSFAAPNR